MRSLLPASFSSRALLGSVAAVGAAAFLVSGGKVGHPSRSLRSRSARRETEATSFLTRRPIWPKTMPP